MPFFIPCVEVTLAYCANVIDLNKKLKMNKMIEFSSEKGLITVFVDLMEFVS